MWRAQLPKVLEGLTPSGTLTGIDWDAFEEAQRQALEPFIAAEVQAGVEIGARALGVGKAVNLAIDWDLVNVAAAEWAKGYVFDLVRDITATTRDSLQAAISGWLEANEAFDDLKKRVEAIFDDPLRAELIATTEATRAIAEGNTQAWEAAGVAEMQWETAVDELVCPICRALHRKRVQVGGTFVVNVRGKTYVISKPPAHPGCHCSLRPVMRP